MKNNVMSQKTLLPQKRLVLKNKKRFAAFLSILLVFAVFMVYTSTVYSYKSLQYITVQVKQGDTLWSIANQYSKNPDIREAVFDIRTTNNLLSSEILAGSEIKIPIQ